MNMSREIWQGLVQSIASIDSAPLWLKKQAELSWEAISALPVIDSAMEGQLSLPEVERKVVNVDYLNFLREQIKLNARGPEWSILLRNRLSALEPCVGRELLVATFHFKPHLATLRLNPESGDLIHVEII